MAAAEARALLDQLMGGDRDAALPKGAALPGRKRGAGGGDGSDQLMQFPGKRHKSCYDKDICPLFCAWGIDVYELFVNTKSDIGPNPHTTDDAARQEYLQLPTHEQERIGFAHLLFHKLGELVQQCDRTVTRNHEKLAKELQRMLQKRGGQDYVVDVEEDAVEQLCRNQWLVEELTIQVEEALLTLKQVRKKEDALSKLQMEAQAKRKKEQEQKVKEEEEAKAAAETKDDEEGETVVKTEENGTTEPSTIKMEEDDAEESATVPPLEGAAPVKMEEGAPKDTAVPNMPSAASLQLGTLILEKQAILCDIARKLTQLGPLQESVETQLRNLHHVKSDITTDKTVCDVSGNFMSARDADERIAAHYAGKQYVGWKLVRDKFQEMLSKYGKYGPPPPGRGPTQAPMGMMAPSRGGGGRGGYGGGGGGDRWGGGRHHGDSSGGFRGGGGGRGRGGGDGRGRGGGDRRSSSPPRWERSGGDGGRGYDRGYDSNRGGGGRGRFDDRRGGDGRGGGDSRGGGGHYRNNNSGGGGGWGRR
jgi:hypothetical protein